MCPGFMLARVGLGVELYAFGLGFSGEKVSRASPENYFDAN